MQKPGHRKKVQNDDMHMDPARLAQVQPPVRAAMEHKAIVESFDDFEADANRAKRWHNRLGWLSLVLLIATLEFGVFSLVATRFGVAIPAEVSRAMLLVGITPFVFTVFSRSREFHDDWVLSRFKAERIRHWKFQQLLNGSYVEGFSDSFAVKWQELLLDLDGGKGRMQNYVNDRPFDAPFRPHPYTDDTCFYDALSIYQQYRLTLQLNWFTQEREHYKQIDQRTENAAGSLLFLSVLAAAIEGVLNFFPHLADNPFVEPGLSAAGIGMALLSAGVRVYRSASGVSESAERYQRLSAQLSWHSSDFARLLQEKTDQKKLLGIAFEIERICHGELVEFIRVAMKSDYIL